jgi:hypothetical protein
MATSTNNTYDIPKGGYVAFDAMSLRQLIVNRLNEQGVFTDQNFIGSNLASIIDIIAYSYHTLIFYLNKTSSESMFSEALLYENMNRIVKLIDYSPIGFQTSTLSFTCSAGSNTSNEGLQQGLYTIPRYSYLTTNNIPFSFNEDITFAKTQDNEIESLEELSNQKLLYQGYYKEYPTYTAAGDDNEIVIINPGNDLVDHFNIDVYVKSFQSGKWEQYTKTPNLFLETGTSKAYEIRLNGNKRYEIKFGNNINGTKLQTGDLIAIYYLTSLGEKGIIGANALNLRTDKRLIRYNTSRFNEIIADLPVSQNRLLTNTEMGEIEFSNSSSSTSIKDAETVEQIRAAAPANYRTQYRLVTVNDYETFIKTNFTNLISDVKCMNNWDYISGYLQYYYKLGLTRPDKTERALFNQIQYADACNFNNVYLLVVPRSGSNNLNYLLPAQKELIRTSVNSNEMITVNTVFVDPIYKFIDIGITSTTNFDFVVNEDREFNYLEIVKTPSSRTNDQNIINDVINIFSKYFSKDNLKLGMLINTKQLSEQILAIEGVETFYTARFDDPNARVEGLSLLYWNPQYPDNDKETSTINKQLHNFEYPSFPDLNLLTNKIKIIPFN